MLKGIHPLLVPDLLAGLARMGNGDVIAVVDRNFPAYGGTGLVIELPSTTVTAVLEAVLTVLPLDQFDPPAVVHMLADDGSEAPATAAARTLWRRDSASITDAGLRRHEGFYARAEAAAITVRTGETLPFGCFLLKKGTV